MKLWRISDFVCVQYYLFVTVTYLLVVEGGHFVIYCMLYYFLYFKTAQI